jgi:hypothetical protein
VASLTLPPDSAPAGWRRAVFASPVPIDPDRLYTASYFVSTGRYAVTEHYFTGHEEVEGPLVAPASEDIGGNGVYLYGAGGGYPTDTYLGSSYWIDVELVVGGSGPSSNG